tara:strand:- start:368 stop:895 length:528 start_codon:yes stop_codon:yes gene_type:complete
MLDYYSDLAFLEAYLTEHFPIFPTTGNRLAITNGIRSQSLVLGVLKGWQYQPRDPRSRKQNYFLGKNMRKIEGWSLYMWLFDFTEKYFPNHPWNAVIFNKNIEYSIHRDRKNLKGTPNLVVTFGDFTGGNLAIYDDDKNQIDSIDARDGYAFNPNTFHSVEPFEGNRYSVVFYTC